MAYGLKACSCHPLRLMNKRHKKQCLLVVYLGYFCGNQAIGKRKAGRPTITYTDLSQQDRGLETPEMRTAMLHRSVWRGHHSSRARLDLTAHNWQKRKSVFLTCHCHKIYRVETGGLINFHLYFLKNTIFVNRWNLGQFREKLIFCQ